MNSDPQIETKFKVLLDIALKMPTMSSSEMDKTLNLFSNLKSLSNELDELDELKEYPDEKIDESKKYTDDVICSICVENKKQLMKEGISKESHPPKNEYSVNSDIDQIVRKK